MQTEEHEIARLLLKKRRILIMVNSLLCTSCIILIFLISCRSVPEKPFIHYTVQSGDTISSISRLYGVPMNEIRQANNLNDDLLYVGDVLILPGVNGINKGSKFQNIPLITRNEWGANAAGSCDKSKVPYTKITVHHTTDNKKFIKTDVEFLRLVQNHHQKTNGWADIGYHFLIGQKGNVYEGRSLRFRGAHVKGKNSGNIGISLLGDYNQTELHPRQIEALKNLIDSLREKYNIPRKMVFGHSELGNTICPGKHASIFLKNYRSSNL